MARDMAAACDMIGSLLFHCEASEPSSSHLARLANVRQLKARRPASGWVRALLVTNGANSPSPVEEPGDSSRRVAWKRGKGGHAQALVCCGTMSVSPTISGTPRSTSDAVSETASSSSRRVSLAKTRASFSLKRFDRHAKLRAFLW